MTAPDEDFLEAVKCSTEEALDAYAQAHANACAWFEDWKRRQNPPPRPPATGEEAKEEAA